MTESREREVNKRGTNHGDQGIKEGNEKGEREKPIEGGKNTATKQIMRVMRKE